MFEKVAKVTCKKALELETVLSTKDDQNRPVNLAGSYDMCWQKRGCGRGYNSKSGVGSLIGKETRKVIGYNSRITNCKQCEINEDIGINKTHDCRMN